MATQPLVSVTIVFHNMKREASERSSRCQRNTKKNHAQLIMK